MSASSQQRPDHEYPPQSAQPYRSIFGSSSQPIEHDEARESDHDVDIEDVLNEELPPMGDDSDDATYDASDEDAPLPERRSTVENKAKEKKKAKYKAPISYSDTDIYRSESPPVHRPNRYHGPTSTWRLWTQKERQVAESLEIIRARDLSAHLFNAHALKRRAREIRKRIAENGSQEEEETAFVPGKLWTAWPMPPEEVPRLDESLINDNDDPYTIKRAPDIRPSAPLEESLIAVMLKISKERFQAREEMPKSYVWHKRESSRGYDTTEASGNEGGWKSEPDTAEGIQYRPVVQADDEMSRRQLRPLTRQILSRLDSLLMSLHHARKASMVPDESSASERQSEAESLASRLSSPRKRRGTSTLERSQSRGRKRARASSRSKSRKRAASNPEEAPEYAIDSSESDSSVSETSRPSKRESTRTPVSLSRSRSRVGGRSARLAIRDWSDVLGIASMTGWPSEVVMRAARRCADLFGEDMTFQTLSEGAVRKTKSTDGRDLWKYSASEEEEPPAPKLKRTRSRAQSTKGESSRAASVVAKEDGEEQSAVRPFKGKGEHRKKDLVCPVKGCSRHTDGFTRTWNLNLHMKRVHPSHPLRSGNKSNPVTDDDG
ncbi:RNA polymerase I-specific transcription initiation factor-domain-containing protein [Paecilomyces variotii]|uniref:RNA polymerase I-specific transcription initiation factor-domain-containing protein n=1 Tax=Byssochlamys spectabilis TaxID=264951 RepID=A0A443I3G5_BYSSP|nr:RNA polymerase I-specific transcription initiation factor-domain-containing protein [Paecilomyces variotii]KAJ9363454.1 hypothetical protein DTO280E4_2436 [Paecilomyces variotii]RWQ98618.1 RNA polymerase I-specific transcription initiation factor-domain-containing protein [Paecilomyces variotii]